MDFAEEAPQPSSEKSKLWTVIAASSAGTLIEWYDFYIFAILTATLSTKFFASSNELVARISTLGLLAVGFVVRPFGALVFGRVGDLVGRKHAFLVTLVMMGLSTTLIGFVPEYSQIGVAAPLLVLVLRAVQGLALGGEYGGAATYVAEHSPDDKRGYYTSFIQTTATLGLLVAIIIVVGGQLSLGAATFDAWGWRVPFLLSAVLVVLSYLIRRRMQESPVYAEMKSTGKTSTNPWKESFGKAENLKLVLIALFGAAAAQGVIWYTAQFYTLFFLQTELKVEKVTANILVAVALIAATPLFVLFGRYSDKVGRKRVMLTGMALAAIGTLPMFNIMKSVVEENKSEPREVVSVTQLPGFKVTKAPADDPKTGVKKGDRVDEIRFSVKYKDGFQAVRLVKTKPLADDQRFSVGGTASIVDLKPPMWVNWVLVSVVFVMVTLVTMVYAPIAALLVEMFPTRIRYSSMSLPYHIGNGVFGGLMPLIATQVVASTGNNLAGLWYPTAVATIGFFVGLLTIKDRHGMSLRDGQDGDVGVDA
jgi:MFS family permease